MTDSLKNNLASLVSNPVFVITYGPPGCGKSATANKSYSNYVIIDVDDIVSNMDGFLNQSQIICNMIQKGIDRDEIEKAAHYIYQTFRDEADRYSESLLDISLSNKDNIVFETTGGSERSLAYLKNTITYVKKQGYWIKIIFPHAPVSILSDRIYTRGKINGRLPSENFLSSAYTYACEHFHEVANFCDEIMVNDSSGPVSVNIYHRVKGYTETRNIDKFRELPFSLRVVLS
ncbi:Hypothetical protein HVR_LOCUS1110 [uncultured virus]|nr:Hypothetical protein HVR_LOCUS1110 [uncultured virus]